MAAMLRLPRSDGLELEVPDAPGLCETCRGSAAGRDGYCSRLCALFDTALDELAAAYDAADGDRRAGPVVIARTRLRAIAAVYDATRAGTGPAPELGDDWDEDVRAGELLPVAFRTAISEVRRLAG